MKEEGVSNYQDYVQVIYTLDENGCYSTVVSDGKTVKFDALEAIWTDIREQCEEIRRQVDSREVSPLAYHMKKSLQDVGILSSYTKFPKRIIRKHLKYDEFMKLDEKVYQKYADAMRITVEELKRADEWK